MSSYKLAKALAKLSGWRERVFILALVQRAQPNLLLYMSARAEQAAAEPAKRVLGNEAAQAEERLARAWDSLLTDYAETRLIEDLDQCQALLRDYADSQDYGARPAGDCLGLLEQALLACLNSDKRRALDASGRSLATVTEFVEFTEGQGLSENQLIKLFDRHELVKREWAFQDALCASLRKQENPTRSFLDHIRLHASDSGVSNIGICLED